MKTKLLILSICPILIVAACNNDQPKRTTEAAKDKNEETIKNDNLQDDADFLVKAAEGGLWEVELGKLAEKKAYTEEAKRLGRMMVKDHTRLNDELKALAINKNIAIPGALSEEKQKKLESFNKKTGRDFDEDYIDKMKDDHEKDIKLFEDKAHDEKADADIRRWAGESLPALENHLTEVKATKEKFDSAKR